MARPIMPKQEDAIIIEDDERRVTKIVDSTFWPEEPELWFTQFDSLPSVATDDKAKYAHILSKIEPSRREKSKT